MAGRVMEGVVVKGREGGCEGSWEREVKSEGGSLGEREGEESK